MRIYLHYFCATKARSEEDKLEVAPVRRGAAPWEVPKVEALDFGVEVRSSLATSTFRFLAITPCLLVRPYLRKVRKKFRMVLYLSPVLSMISSSGSE